MTKSKRKSKAKSARLKMTVGSLRIDVRFVIGFLGLILSIVLHELFHIIMHWGHVTSISFFSNHYAIVQLTVDKSSPFNAVEEEAIAYIITSVVALFTMIAIWRVSDKKDTRTFTEIIAPWNHSKHQSRRMVQMANKKKLLR